MEKLLSIKTKEGGRNLISKNLQNTSKREFQGAYSFAWQNTMVVEIWKTRRGVSHIPTTSTTTRILKKV